jgi:hypothetical protein
VVRTYGCIHEVGGSTLRGEVGLQSFSACVLTGAHVCKSWPKCDGLHGVVLSQSFAATLEGRMCQKIKNKK